jgi:ABC-type bacteriocin/lantibiotic exporter with double-glycine peptidase domain
MNPRELVPKSILVLIANWPIAMLLVVAAGVVIGVTVRFPQEAAKPGGRVVRDPENACAIISASMVSHILGHPITLSEGARYIHVDGRGQTSMAELLTGLDRLGFAVAGVRLSGSALNRLSLPVILHFDDSHFVVCRALGDHSIVVFDPPNQPTIVDVDSISDRWDGLGLIVSRDQRSLHDAIAAIGLSK